MKKYAIIVAGGSGQRMGAPIPKQFLLLNNKPLLQHTIEAFAAAYTNIEIILVLPAEHMERGKTIVAAMHLRQRVHFAEGGSTRFHSAKKGLALVSSPSIVFVHDAVRCLVSPVLIQRCYEQAVASGSAIPAVSATDSIRLADASGHKAVDRDSVKIIQTPQTFQSAILLKAFEQDYHPSFTDEATAVEMNGQTVHLIEGDYHNLKITRPVDLLIAEKILEGAIA